MADADDDESLACWKNNFQAAKQEVQPASHAVMKVVSYGLLLHRTVAFSCTVMAVCWFEQAIEAS